MYEIKKIRNYEQLIGKGDSIARQKVLQLMDAVLQEVDAGKRIREIMRLDGDILTVGCRTWDLAKKRNIYLIGAGKACNAMAEAVCDILGERITKGIISIKIQEETDRYCNTEVYVGGHPLPNREGMVAAQRMIELINAAGPEDLFVAVTSGGSSALLTYPVDGITLEEEIVAQDLLLKSGAKIVEINAVRRHISRTNGGRLAELICNRAGAELISLMVSDGVGLPSTAQRGVPTTFSGTPVAPDATTIQDARNMIINYDLAQKLPASIVDYVMDDARIRETPKAFDEKLTTFLVGSIADSCEAAIEAAEKMGDSIMVLTTFLEGESREAGHLLSSIAREIKTLNRPIKAPCFLVCAGETTTSINTPPAGMGGPSQELVLGFSIGIKDYPGVAAASIDTEGTDGTTIYAGGICDRTTFGALEAASINVYEALRSHASGNALLAIGDNIFTGNTGTNLCDLNVIYIA
ncbi:MAG: DUF4147 domain-containing protein [Candidatus Pelethousia sp.]|nr:DUF4147 domain-containing protein [Candidatus Pelethousia sp.]